MILNGGSVSDSTALDAFQEWGEGRWSPVVKKPAVVIHGADTTTVAEAIAIPDARKTDRVNIQLTAPGSRNLPQVNAARQVARIISRANNTPSRDYTGMQVDGITPGIDSVQWDLLKRDAAVKGGSSTVEVIDDVIRVSNVCTFYHPTGEIPPSYKYLVDIVKLQNCVFALDTIFSSPEWAGCALVPDDQPVTEATAKKPKMALAEISRACNESLSSSYHQRPDLHDQELSGLDRFTESQAFERSYASQTKRQHEHHRCSS